MAAATGVSLSLKAGTGTLGGTLPGTIAAGASQVDDHGRHLHEGRERRGAHGDPDQRGRVDGRGAARGSAVNPGAATALAFTTQPGNTTPGSAIPGPPAVAVRDGQGNTVTSSTATVTVAIGSNPGGGTLSGTTTRSATAGVASFGGLTINAPGVGYTLSAT